MPEVIAVNLLKNKKTPGTARFAEVDSDGKEVDRELHPLQVYLSNERWKLLGNPDAISITIAGLE